MFAICDSHGRSAEFLRFATKAGCSVIAVLLLVGTTCHTSAAATYTQLVGWDEPFLNNPFHVSNAVAFQELFAPDIRYWAPAVPNVEGIVTLKFEAPIDIASASFVGGISAYTVGSDANFDPNAATYLDVSTDNLAWTTIASQTNQNASGSGIGGPWDLGSLVEGANVVYLRSRMFTTTSLPGFSASQFMRQGAPYLPGAFTAMDGPLSTLVNLEFDTFASVGIDDANGVKTGLTHRLPGTGGSIPDDDPNLNQQTTPGYMAFASTRSDISQLNGFGRNLGNLDAPGVLITNMVGRDFRVSAKFDDINVPGLSDQLLLYVGTDADHVLRGGFHENATFDPSGDTAQLVLAGNTGAGDFGFPGIGLPETIATGDDVILSLSRLAGEWQLEWENLTNPAASGSYQVASMPWLDGESELYVGLMHMDARNFVSQTANVDFFRVQLGAPVPEPSSAGICVVIASAGLLFRRTKLTTAR